MDDQRFLNALRIRDEGRLREAVDEFLKIAEGTDDLIDKAGILLNAATTLSTLGEYDAAEIQLNAARTFALSPENPHSNARADKRRVHLEVELDFETADLSWARGLNEDAVAKFDHLFDKHSAVLRKPEFRDAYEIIRTRRAFVLADLGRWREALPILEEARSFQALKEGIAFYLGHCYLAAHDYERAKDKLIEALRLDLPKHLEFRAHCELGMAYHRLGNYLKAKLELERGAERADTNYLRQSQVWKWLEITCQALGLKDEAQHYARLSRPS